jgi:hypothetical protein
MLASRPFFSKYPIQILAGMLLIIISSCGVVPKNYPIQKPFVFKYNVVVEGNFKAEQKNDLESRLSNQLDDSIRVRTARKLIYRGINRPVLNKPPLYDSNNADKSILYMRALLVSLGYFKDTITYKTFIDTVEKNQYRTTINFKVKPGKLVTIDSFRYNFKNEELQKIALDNQQGSYIKKGGPFAKSTISVEMDRLVDIYRNKGYLRFGREDMIGQWDTLDISLLQATLDPFEEIEILQKLKERKQDLKANLEIKLKPGYDSSKLRKYFIGNVTVYPDYDEDSTQLKKKEVIINGVKIIYNRKIFKPGIFPENIYLVHDSLYAQRNYFKTINRFNLLGSWRLVNIEQIARKDQDTVDIKIKLTPARKYSFTSNLEGSNNQNAVSGNLFGLSVNFGLQNRNFARSAIQSNTNIRFGVELSDKNFVQSRQFIVSHNFYFPRVIPNLKFIKGSVKESFRTSFAFNFGSTARKDLYNLTTINGSWGYEFRLKKSLINLRLPNIEYSFLKPKQNLLNLFDNNPAIRNIFTDGFISSINAGISTTGGKNKNQNLFRSNMELAGFPASFIKNSKFLDSNLYQYLKLDAEFSRKIVFRKSALALHFFAGMGYEFNSTVNPKKKNNLPFFKQYFSGGPNSMRAWGLRKLGPGSTVKNFTDSAGYFERYGDVQLETNIEWRFPLFIISDIKVNGALFTDIGNIWFLKKQAQYPEEVFNFNRLGKDIAVGVGGGLRIDFSFFVARLDYSYKAKNPSPALKDAASQNKWFHNIQLFNGQFQLGISYPFIL